MTNLTLLEIKRFFSDEEYCWSYLEDRKWDGTPWCPYCSCQKAYDLSRKHTYKCSDCKKTFTAKIGTIFESSPKPLTYWFEAIYEIVRHTGGMPTTLWAEHMGICYKTAWLTHQKVMELFKFYIDDATAVVGVFEFDEKGVGPKKDRMSKQRRERGGFDTMKAGPWEKVGVLGFINRTAKQIFGVVLGRFYNSAVIEKYVRWFIDTRSTAYSDKSKLYNVFKEVFNKYIQFNHHEKHFGHGGERHSNTIEGAFGNYQRMMNNYKRQGGKYIQRYWDEFCFRHSCGLKKLKLPQRFEAAFDNIGRRITLDKIKAEGAAMEQFLKDNEAEHEAKMEEERLKKEEANQRKIAKEAAKADSLPDSKQLCLLFFS